MNEAGMEGGEAILMEASVVAETEFHETLQGGDGPFYGPRTETKERY